MSINENGTNRVDRDVASETNKIFQKNGIVMAEELLALVSHHNNDAFKNAVMLAYDKLACDKFTKSLNNISQELEGMKLSYFSEGVPTINDFTNDDFICETMEATVKKYSGKCSKGMHTQLYSAAIEKWYQFVCKNIEKIQMPQQEQAVVKPEVTITEEPVVVTKPEENKMENTKPVETTTEETANTASTAETTSQPEKENFSDDQWKQAVTDTVELVKTLPLQNHHLHLIAIKIYEDKRKDGLTVNEVDEVIKTNFNDFLKYYRHGSITVPDWITAFEDKLIVLKVNGLFNS